MKHQFVGRSNEYSIFDEYYKKDSSQLIVVYGRRRIGKSDFLKQFGKNKTCYYFEGLEMVDTKQQIHHFTKQLIETEGNLSQHLKFENWTSLFYFFKDQLNNKKRKKRIYIVFDELQWMAAGQTKLISLIKYFWDNHWKESNVMLVLCGSIASFMINKVIKSKALYGRINLELKMKGFSPYECSLLLKKRSYLEILKYNIVLGAVPKYLQEIDPRKSFENNIVKLYFTENALMLTEIEKVFYGQFKSPESYRKIVLSLSNGPQTFEDISKKTKIASGGGLKEYLILLENADFIQSVNPINKQGKKSTKYKLIDEHLRFYFKFIYSFEKNIKDGFGEQIFRNKVLPVWKPWLGLSFELFCKKNSDLIARIAGFEDKVIKSGELIGENYQIDIVFERSDNVLVIGEIKFNENLVNSDVISEMEQKIIKLTEDKTCIYNQKPNKIGLNITIERMIIHVAGLEKRLKSSQYFNYEISLEQMYKTE